MSDAQKILKMIEEVSPDDTAKLDEIDARVFVYVAIPAAQYISHSKNPSGQTGYSLVKFRYPSEFEVTQQLFNEYTRSRDDLKAIRPKDWNWYSGKDGDRFFFKMGYSHSGNLPTEELAELHAIIQAIEYERTHNA